MAAPDAHAPPSKAASAANEAMEGATEGMQRLGMGLADAMHRGAAAVARTASRAGGGSGGTFVDLQRYVYLQHRISELHGMQVGEQLAHTQRSEASLQRRLKSLLELQQQAEQGAAKASAQFAKLGMGQWYPGKVLFSNQDKRLVAAHKAAEEADALAKQRKGQVAELRRQLQATQQRVEAWEAQVGELTVARAEAQVMEECLFGSSAAGPHSPTAQRRLELLDCLCAMEASSDEEEEEEVRDGEGGEACPKEPPDAVASEETQDGGASAAGEAAPPVGQQLPPAPPDAFGRWGRGRLLRIVASKLGDPGKDEDGPHGRLGHGRLLRIAADRLERAAAGGELEVEVAGSEELRVSVEGVPFTLGEVVREEAEVGGANNEVQPGLGGGTGVLRSAAGGTDPQQQKDKFGAFGRGRLLRITADRLRRAADARRREREAAVCKVAAGIGGHAGQEPLDGRELAELFPPQACKFNPALHCPPSTFLWTYPNRFMGRLKRLRTGDVEHAFFRFGPFAPSPAEPGGGERLPLLLLSGMGSTMVSWGVPLMRALSLEHEVVIMDYRGAGLSRYHGSQPWDYFQQTEAVLMLADALGIRRFNWLGWSSGGNVGLILAALHSQRLGRMVSHAGVAGGKNTVAPAALRFLDPDARVSLGQTMALVFPPHDAAEFRRTCAQYIKEVFSMPKSIVDAEVSRRAAKEQFLADQRFLGGEEEVWGALPRVPLRCLLSNGTADVLVPPDNARRLAARIPGAQLRLWEGWGHGWKDSAAFARMVNDFLSDGGGDGGGSGREQPL